MTGMDGPPGTVGILEPSRDLVPPLRLVPVMEPLRGGLETDGTDNRDDLLKAAQSMIVVKVEVEG